MYALKTIKESIKRGGRTYGLAAAAVAALILLSNMAAPAQVAPAARGRSYVGQIGLARGQSVRVSVFHRPFMQDGSVRTVKYTLRGYDAIGRLVHQTDPVELSHELGHTLGFRHEHTRPDAQDPRTGRAQVWIELQTYSMDAPDTGAATPAPTLELVDDATGETVAQTQLVEAVSYAGERYD